MLHDWSTHPINFRISTYGLMEGINHDHFKVLIRRILANPVGIEDTETLNPTTHAFLSNRLQIPHGLLLFDSAGSFGFAIRTSLGHWPFAASATHGDPVDDESLLVLVSQAPGLVWTGWSWGSMNLGQLTVLPTTNTQEVSHHITLLFAVQLRHVLVRPHCTDLK